MVVGFQHHLIKTGKNDKQIMTAIIWQNKKITRKLILKANGD